MNCPICNKALFPITDLQINHNKDIICNHLDLVITAWGNPQAIYFSFHLDDKTTILYFNNDERSLNYIRIFDKLDNLYISNISPNQFNLTIENHIPFNIFQYKDLETFKEKIKLFMTFQ